MDPADLAELLLVAREMRLRAGISQRTVCQALGLFPSEVSYWENQKRGIRLTRRSLRYGRFLAGLRRAEINQAAAQVLLADDETCARPEVWQQPPARAGEVGADRGVG